jgi:hypothetical protein
MRMGTSEADNDEGLNEDKPFSPMYPVFNFGTTAPQPQAGQPPPYEFSPPHLPPRVEFQEKRGF